VTPAAPNGGPKVENVSRGRWWYAGVAALVATAVGAAFLFYFGGFEYLLSSDSASFSVELALAQARAHPEASVVVLGNSTAAEGFRPNWFKSHASGAVALNLGVPSGWIYLWQRMLVAAIGAGVHPRAVVVMLTPDVVSATDFDYLLNDLALLKIVLDPSDLARVAPYARSPRQYVDYAIPVLARPLLFRAEMRDFISRPIRRLREAKHIHDWFRSFHQQALLVETDNRFSVCQAGPLNALDKTMERLRGEKSPLLPDFARVQAGYAARAHVPLRIDAYKTGRLRALLAGIAGRHIAVYVTEAPFWDPDFDEYPETYRRDFSSTVRQVAESVPGVTLLPKLDVDCGMMLDTVHLNRKGGEIFTQYLMEHLAEHLGPRVL
jgi:hypothetical protein